MARVLLDDEEMTVSQYWPSLPLLHRQVLLSAGAGVGAQRPVEHAAGHLAHLHSAAREVLELFEKTALKAARLGRQHESLPSERGH